VSTITEALQSSWHVHDMREYAQAHEPDCAVQSQPCQEEKIDGLGATVVGHIAPWCCQVPHLRLRQNLRHVLRFFVLCILFLVRGTGKTAVHAHTLRCPLMLNISAVGNLPCSSLSMGEQCMLSDGRYPTDGSPGLIPLIDPGVCAKLKEPRIRDNYPIQLPGDVSEWAGTHLQMKRSVLEYPETLRRRITAMGAGVHTNSLIVYSVASLGITGWSRNSGHGYW